MKKGINFLVGGFLVFVGIFISGCTAPRYTLSGVKENRLIELKNDSKFFVQVKGESGWE
ncbi:MAG: hypothetical protein KKC21_00370 [Nitrospinae bacterium]|nr:hypothetical protein [Nitrospinota bacterium]